MVSDKGDVLMKKINIAIAFMLLISLVYSPVHADEVKEVYLTFDDGPIPEVTPRVLEILRNYGVKATFFMVGDNVRKYPEVFEMVKSDGHRLGNHTFNHLGGIKHSTKDYVLNIHKANAYIHSDLFRPPHGWLRHRQYYFLKRHYKLVMWDLVTRDYSKRLNADDVFENVRRYARPGSIITFHDSLRSVPKLWSALPRSIEWLLAEGYEFRVIP